MAKRDNTDLQNLKLALERKELMVHQYENQIRAFEDPKINVLLEGLLHNERTHQVEIKELIEELEQ
jgi:rubrerythrin